MCCFAASIMFLGPRFAFLVYWLMAPIRVAAAFAQFNLPWLVGWLGLLFAPWTTLMFVLVFPLNGFDWIWLGFGVAADVAGYMGGYANRRRVPGYPETDPLPTL
jgi:hypothetical protein